MSSDAFEWGLHSFEEWRSKGFSIRKGAKHVKRNAEGVPLVSHEQVVKNFVPSYDGVDYLADAEFWAEANPMALYRQTLREPHRPYSRKAGAILARNLT